MIPLLPYLRLRAELEAERPARLPPFKGSMLRGAFGHALRGAVCVMGPQQPCVTCSLRRVCVYTRLFETFIEEAPPPFLRGLATAPRPYVFEPGDERRDFAPGDRLRFDLLLLGQAVELQGYAALAVERMAAAGLGVRRVPFRLLSLCCQDAGGELRQGWDAQRRRWTIQAGALLPAGDGGEGGAPAGESGADLVEEPATEPAARGGAGSLTLRFHTPTRIQAKKRLVDRPGFRLLAFHMFRRTLELAHFHLPGADIDWSFQPPLEQAGRVAATHRLTWRDRDRYSNRQQRKMTLGGFVGDITLEGDLRPFLPLLYTAEIIHVGKGATFGLGKLEVVREALSRRAGHEPSLKSAR